MVGRDAASLIASASLLIPFDKRLHVLRRDQPHPVAHALQSAAPMVRPHASLKNHLGRRQFAEERFDLSAPDLATHH